MKKILSLMFAIIFAVGICFSAPIGANAATTDDLSFELNEDKKSYSVVKCNVSDYKEDGDFASPIDLVIPSEYKGLPVTKISTYAFSHCGAVKSIVIPDSVTVIEAQAFEWCSSLANVTMSKNITSVGMWCFGKTKFYDTAKNWVNGVLYCGNVLVEAKENISGACTIKNGTKCIADSAFRFREKLTSVTIPNTVTHIGNDAFYGCALSKVVIPEGVVSVGGGAFGGNQKLTIITFPKSVKNLGIEVLANCENLKTVNYNGTKAEWSKIKIHKQNTHLLKAKLVCTGKQLVLATPTVKISNTAKGVKVTWNAIKNAENYIIYRQTYNASTKKWSGWTTIKKGVAGTSYVDGTVKLGTQYRYTVRAVSGSVMSKYTASATLKYNVTPTVKIANASNGVKVSWSIAPNATGYTVYRSQYNTSTKKWSGWKTMGTAKSDKSSWVDKSVKSGVQYKYAVRACNGSFKSSYKASSVILYLAQPTVKIANALNGINVSWNKVAGSKGYTVYRSEYVNGAWSSWKNMGTAQNTKTSWVDKSVVSGTTYRYTVRVINGNYKSNYKATSGLIYLAQPTVKIANDSKGVKVSWNQIAGAKTYIVYSSTYDANTKKWSSWKVLGNASATSFVDESSVSGVQYKYTVRAVNGDYKSAYTASNVLLHLAQPYVEAEKSGTDILVTWRASIGAENYVVYRSEYQGDKWTDWSEIFNSKSESYQSCSYLDESVKTGVSYRYTVKAVKGNYESTFMTTGPSVTLIAAPKVSAKFVSNEIVVSWDAVPDAIWYDVYRKSYDSEKNRWNGWERVSNSQKTLTYKDSNITFSTDYIYAVEAMNVETSSEYGESNTVRANIAPVVTAAYKDDGVYISWNTITGAESYIIYKCKFNEEKGEWGDWSQIKNNLTSTEYIDTDVITGSYKYAVCAKKGVFYGPNAFSDVVKCDISVYVSIGNKKIAFSDDANSLKTSFGTPTEILVSQTSKEKTSYYVYSNDYSKLTIVTLTDSDGVVSVYTLDSSAVFKTGFTEMSFTGYNGESYIYNTNGSTEYFVDNLGTKSVYAVMFSKRNISANNIDVSGDVKTYEKLNFHCTNACRAINGVQVLSYNENVATVARAHSKDMADRNYFSHTNLENASPGDRLRSGGIDWMACGENIDAGYRTPFDMSDGWYNSSGHRSNMLNSIFTHLGVGIAYNPESDYGFYGTQNFIA